MMISCSPNGWLSYEPSNQPSVCRRCGKYWQDHYKTGEKSNIGGGSCTPNGLLKFEEGNQLGVCRRCGGYRHQHYNKSNTVMALSG